MTEARRQKKERATFQVSAPAKAALERAAADDKRSVASFVELTVVEKLLDKGYLGGTIAKPTLPPAVPASTHSN